MARARIEIKSPADLARLMRQAKPAGGKPRGRSKYKAVKATYRGLSYDSRAEAAHAKWLDSEVAARRVLWWVKAPTFHLGCPENKYRPDFLVVVGTWQKRGDEFWFPVVTVYLDDVKGSETRKFKHDKKLWASYGPTTLRVVKLTLSYGRVDEHGLPSIRKVEYEIIEGGNR